MPIPQRKTVRRSAAVVLATLLSLAPFLATAEVYKVIDEQGRVIFTDSPPPGSKAERIEIRDSNRLPATPMQPKPQEADQPPPVPDYRLAITSPPQDFHVTPGIRDLNVEISVEPSLRAGHRIELTDNGEVVPGRTLQNIVIRGTHVLLARVLDKDGNVISESEPVHIHVHRPSVGGR